MIDKSRRSRGSRAIKACPVNNGRRSLELHRWFVIFFIGAGQFSKQKFPYMVLI